MTTTQTTSANVKAAIGPKLRSRFAPVALMAAVLAACSGGSKDSSDITVRSVVPTTASSVAATTVPGTGTTTSTVVTGVSIAAPTVTAVLTESPAGEEGKLDPNVQAQLLDTMTKYVQLAVTAPLGGSTTPVAVDQFLTAHAASALTADRRAVLTDEGVPAMQSAQAKTNSVTFTGLVGTDTQMSVVSAHLDLAINGTSSGVATSITRSGDLTLIPESGGWRIDAFDMNVERDLP